MTQRDPICTPRLLIAEQPPTAQTGYLRHVPRQGSITQRYEEPHPQRHRDVRKRRMSQQWWKGDDQLLAALGAALRSERSVPAGFIPLGKAAFSWRGIDAELATLTCDPVFEGTEAGLAGVPSEPASPRRPRFTSGELTVEIVVTDDAILGQLVPPGPGRVEARTPDGTMVTAVIDQGGGFTIVRPDPLGSFRLTAMWRTARVS